MARLKGKVAVITGGANGIGRAICERFCEEGAIVIIADMNEAAGQQVAKTLGAQTSFFQLDVREKDQWHSLMNEVTQKHGKLDILVNNAGITKDNLLMRMSDDQWDDVLNINLKGSFTCIRSVIKHMMKKKFGRIINITSSSVKAPIDILGLSNGARSGLTGFVAGIARKTIINNVTINSILPGPFDTDRLRNSFKFVSEKTGKSIEEVREARAAENPSGRFGNPKEFGVACAYLCSSHAGYITGQNLLIDGGGYPGTY